MDRDGRSIGKRSIHLFGQLRPAELPFLPLSVEITMKPYQVKPPYFGYCNGQMPASPARSSFGKLILCC
jgi:hypothetical protein